MKKFFSSQERFNTIDGANFGLCLDQIQQGNKLIEWRIRLLDGKPCIIQYYEDGRGYAIYEPEIPQ